MEDDVEICRMIRDGFRSGQCEEELFKTICQKRGSNLPSYSAIFHWLERFRYGDLDLEVEVGDFYYKLLCAITISYLKFKNAVSIQEDWKYSTETFLDNRFLFAANGDPNLFTLVDSFTATYKSLKSDIKQTEKTYYFCAFWIGRDRILLGVRKGFIDHLYLLRFDGINYTLLNQVTCGFEYCDIILDSEDNTRFVLYNDNIEDENSILYKCHLSKDRICIENQQFEFDCKLLYGKLESSKFSAFRMEFDENGIEDWEFVEYDLSSDIAREINRWPDFNCPICLGCSRDHFTYVWSKRRLYTSCSSFCSGKQLSISAFDPETRIWTILGIVVGGVNCKLAIDDDEILTIVTDEDYRDRKTPGSRVFYRIPMRQPDKLSNLVWSSIRRSSMFFGSDLYEKLVLRLPYNSEYRPFSVNA